MSAFIGFNVANIRPTGQEVGVVDWKYQPYNRGSNPKPDPEDSALLTLQVLPTYDDYDGGAVAVGYSELFARMAWSAGASGYLTCEFDLIHGVSATVTATSIKLAVVYAVPLPGFPPPLAPPDFKSVTINASLGRGSRSSSEVLTRTRYLGPLGAGVTSVPVKIPNFARTLLLTSRAPAGAAFVALVVQRSGSPTGPIVQADTVTGTQPVQQVLVSAIASYVEVTPVAAQDLSVVFRIILP
jgi:hypothetical protein